MSDNAAAVIIVCALLASITLCSLFRAWRDRGVARHNATATGPSIGQAPEREES